MMLTKLCLLSFLGLAMVAAGANMATAANPIVAIETSMGTIKVELYEEKAPITVKNFLDYVDDKFYDGTIFHRVMGKESSKRDFMIQGGGFEPGLVEKKNKKPPIKNEARTAKISNTRGTIAMARTNVPDSATNQFFINLTDDNTFLDPSGDNPAGYAAFGKVIEGMDVVDKIKAVKVANRGGNEAVPLEDIVIKSIRRVEKDKDAEAGK